MSVAKTVGSVLLYYRHVNHAERYKTIEMKQDGKSFRAEIPAGYTDSLYPLEYYFEVRENPDKVWLYPGFNKSLTNQPYFVVRKT